jgi:multidrug efflux pump
MLQAALNNRGSLADLRNIYVRSTTQQEPIPLDNLVTVKEVGDAATLNRFNRMRSITLTGNVAAGYSLGQVLDFLEKTVRTELPPEVQIGYTRGSPRTLKRPLARWPSSSAWRCVIAYLTLGGPV